VSAYNLCTIFFNLLNNAIEAADKTTKRKIWVICQYTQKELIVEIGNYYCNNQRLDKNRLQTTKRETDYHGWGMKNVEDSVAECRGLMDIEIVDDKFVVSITLENRKEDMENENSNCR
jgi:sensor histidine kinase regulating citrate/malate metabolism